MILLFHIEKIELIFTSPLEIYFLELKVMGLFGFISAAIFFGTTAPKAFNRLQRFLILAIPSVAMCGIVFAGKKALLLKLLEVENFDIKPAITVSSLKMEMVPFSGLLISIVIIVFLFKRSGQQQNSPDKK